MIESVAGRVPGRDAGAGGAGAGGAGAGGAGAAVRPTAPLAAVIRRACEEALAAEPDASRRPVVVLGGGAVELLATPAGATLTTGTVSPGPRPPDSGCFAALSSVGGQITVVDLLAAGVTAVAALPASAAGVTGSVLAGVLERRWPPPEELVLVGWGAGAPDAPGVVVVASLSEALHRRRRYCARVTLVGVGPLAEPDDVALAALAELALAKKERTTALLLSGFDDRARLVLAAATGCRGAPGGGVTALVPAVIDRAPGSLTPGDPCHSGAGGTASEATSLLSTSSDSTLTGTGAGADAQGAGGSRSGQSTAACGGGTGGAAVPAQSTAPPSSSPDVGLRLSATARWAATGTRRLQAAGSHAADPRSAPAAGRPIEIAVLGPVVVCGAEGAFDRRPTLTELVTYLALHRGGATTESWSTAVWPERRVPVQTVANRLSEARRALGAASDGLPRLRRRGDRHLLVDVKTDWERFQSLAVEDATEDRRRALSLVRGRPFADLRRGHWTVIEGLESEVVAAVAACARRLGEELLTSGDPDGASWAAHQGLRAAPWDERLHRLLMRSADAAGDRGGGEEALRQLALRLEIEGDPLRAVHPLTASLYERLTARS